MTGDEHNCHIQLKRSKADKTARVTFHEVVEVHCFQNEQTLTTRIHADDMAKCCRSLWHLHGQVTAVENVPSVLSHDEYPNFHVPSNAAIG